MGAHVWFWLIPIVGLLQQVASYVRNGSTIAGSSIPDLVLTLLFVAVFGPTGYRITVNRVGLRVTGLGFMRVHEAVYAWIWRRASVVPGDLQLVKVVPQPAFLRFINWPLLFPGKRSRQHFAFGTPSVVRVERKGRKHLTLGTRRPKELRAAVQALGAPDSAAINPLAHVPLV